MARLIEARSDVGWLLRLLEVSDADIRSRMVVPTLDGDGEVERLEIAGAIAVDVGDRGLLDQLLHLETHMRLPNRQLIVGDKMSMAASLEQRVPFLDVELMRFVERVPAAVRMKLGTRKRLLRRAARAILPPDVARRRKRPFFAPYDHQFRTSLGDELRRRFAPGSGLSDFIDPGAMSRLLAEHRSRRADHTTLLVCLLEFSEWHRSFIEERFDRRSESTPDLSVL